MLVQHLSKKTCVWAGNNILLSEVDRDKVNKAATLMLL